MSKEVNLNSQSSDDDSDPWMSVFSTAVLSGIALWGFKKISEAFTLPEETSDQSLLDYSWSQYSSEDIKGGRATLYEWVRMNLARHNDLNSLSWILSTQRIDPEASVEIAEHVVKNLAPEVAAYWDTLAEAYLAIGKQEEARRACIEAYKYAPDQPTQFTLCIRLGWIYEMQPLIHLALQEYQKAIAINSPVPPYDLSCVYAGLGRCHSANGDWNRAVEAFEQALAYNAGNPYIKCLLANGLIGVSPPRLQEAETHLQYAISAWPEYDLPYFLLVCAKARAGDCSGALYWCEKGIRYFSDQLIEAIQTEPILQSCRRQLIELLIAYGRKKPAQPTASRNTRRLIDEMESKQSTSLPYFISFYQEEAKQLAEGLRASLGDRGFLSITDQGSGSQWKHQIATNLKRARTFIMLETASYHTRPSCQVERAFAYAAGMRILRIGLYKSAELSSVPTYVNDLQYAQFGLQHGLDSALAEILMAGLPDPIRHLKTRMDAALELVKMLTPSQVNELAYRLGFWEEIRNISAESNRFEFLSRAFRSESVSNLFCQEIDLVSMFSSV